MDKRYQVFVSSTFSDLENERGKVIQTLMKMDCIPSGMELFPAADEEQFEFIKRVIDDCDYYLLIIGGRYGSISSSGVSYTELEYEYTLERGLKVIALLHKNPEDITVGKSESDPGTKQKLLSFRKRVSENRLVAYWEKIDELPGVVALSVLNAIKMYPTVGWVRGNRITTEETQLRLLQLDEENIRLKEELKATDVRVAIDSSNLSKGEETFEVDYSYELELSDSSTKATINDSIALTWNEIFSVIGAGIFGAQSDSGKTLLSNYVFQRAKHKIFKEHGDTVTTSSVRIEEDSFSTILFQFRALGLLTHDGSRWKLTSKGDLELLELRAIKTIMRTPEMKDESGAT